MRADTARRIRTTATTLDTDHPEMTAGGHLRDAARVLQYGSTEGAKRHLDAAMELLTPRNLYRHGITDDEGHATAKHHLHAVHRHRLQVEDIEELRTRNDGFRQPPPGDEAEPGQAIAAAGDHGNRVIDLRNSTAWKREKRDREGQWTGGVPHGPPLPTSGQGVVGAQEMLRAMAFQPSLHQRSPGFVGRKGDVLGRHMSLPEARGAAEAFGPRPLSERKGGLLPGQLEQRKSLSKSQRVIYGKLRQRGRAHAGAFLIAARFQPGMLESAVLAGHGPAIELSLLWWKHEPRAPSGKWMRSGSPAAGHLDGRLAHGVTRKGQPVRGYYSHARGTVTARHSGAVAVHFVRPATSKAPRVKGGGKAFVPANLAGGGVDAVELASSHGRHTPGTPFTYKHGWARVDSQTQAGRFGSGLLAGSFEHINAIEDLAERAGAGSGDPGRRSPTMRTALHNVAKAVGGRDMRRARVHLDAARWANQHEARGYYSRDLRDLRRQLELVPPGVTGWEGKIKNPLSQAGQHPGKYVSRSTRPPAHPAAGARRLSYQTYSNATELSARTALLERTPAPRGRPGGPGLYGVKGMGHTAYLQQVVKALIEKRGMPESKAYAVARAAIRRWMRGGAHAHPEVVAAAGRAEAGEVARQARAHSHAIGWEVADTLIELAAEPIELFNPYHAPPGAGGGQFVAAGGAGAQQGKGKAAKRAQLRRKIAALRHQIAGLERQYRALTGRGHPKKITAAAKKAGKAQTPQQAAAAARATAKAKKTTGTPRKKGPSAATVHLKILALRAEMKGYIAQLQAL